MEFRSPGEESIRLASPLIRILGTFFSGGVARAGDIESAHFIGSAWGSNIHPTNWFCSSCHSLVKTPTLFLLQLPAVITLLTNSPRLDAAPSMPPPNPALNLTAPRLPVCTPVVSIEVLHYLHEVPIATHTLTKPVIPDRTTTPKGFQ